MSLVRATARPRNLPVALPSPWRGACHGSSMYTVRFVEQHKETQFMSSNMIAKRRSVATEGNHFPAVKVGVVAQTSSNFHPSPRPCATNPQITSRRSSLPPQSSG